MTINQNERGKIVGELLLEIGTEEIPSDYLEDGLRALKLLAQDHFEANRIGIRQLEVGARGPSHLR